MTQAGAATRRLPAAIKLTGTINFPATVKPAVTIIFYAAIKAAGSLSLMAHQPEAQNGHGRGQVATFSPPAFGTCGHWPLCA